MVDFHCHLDLYPKPVAVVNQCKEKQLYVLSVTTTPSAWIGTSRIAKDCPRIRTALGLHPQLAHQRSHELEMFDALISEAKYVGEIGLDGSKDFKPFMEAQLKVFRHILKTVNQAGGRVMSIHSRSSASAVISELATCDCIPVYHWFTGNKSELQQAIASGGWFSVGPSMLSTKKGQELVAMLPRDKVLTETDGPFAQFKGNSLMPWDVDLAFIQLAKIWNLDKNDAIEVIQGNFRRLVSFA